MKTIEGRNLEFTLLKERSQSEKGICCVVPTNGILEKPKLSDQIRSDQSLSRVRLFATP